MRLNKPPIKSKFDNEDAPSGPWVDWTGQIHDISRTVIQSGTTAQRPAIKFIGQQYFDTSLGANGRPIFVNKLGTGWVLADGSAA